VGFKDRYRALLGRRRPVPVAPTNKNLAHRKTGTQIGLGAIENGGRLATETPSASPSTDFPNPSEEDTELAKDPNAGYWRVAQQKHGETYWFALVPRKLCHKAADALETAKRYSMREGGRFLVKPARAAHN
jgi:hypothetical protein